MSKLYKDFVTHVFSVEAVEMPLTESLILDIDLVGGGGRYTL